MPFSSRAVELTQNTKFFRNGPCIKFPKTTKPEFRSTLETAVLSGLSTSIATVIQALELKDGFKLFALPGIDRIDFDSGHVLDDPSLRRLHLIDNAADAQGWAAYVVRVRASYFDNLRRDPSSTLAQLEDEESGFLRNLGARNIGLTQ